MGVSCRDSNETEPIVHTCIVRAFLSFSSSETAVFCLSVMFSHSLRRSALARTFRREKERRYASADEMLTGGAGST